MCASLAVTAQLGDRSRLLVDQADTYELRYNAGCNHASVGDWETAERVLGEAERAAKQFLEEDEAGEDEILEETGEYSGMGTNHLIFCSIMSNPVQIQCKHLCRDYPSSTWLRTAATRPGQRSPDYLQCGAAQQAE